MRRKGFYVSAIDGKRSSLMLGPFASHEAALARVDACRRKADDLDGRAWFWAWGTCRVVTEKSLPKGTMNAIIGVDTTANAM
jgi:hypothetical protein